MKRYSGNSGKPSGVLAFEESADAIVIKFQRGELYKYSASSCGSATVKQLKQLANRGEGLSTFISRNHPAYEWKKVS